MPDFGTYRRAVQEPARQDEINHEALSLQWRHTQQGNIARLSYRLRTLRNQVSARDARSLNEAVERMEDATKVQLSASGQFTHAFNEQARTVGLLGLLLMPVLAWFAVKWMQRKQQRQAATQAIETVVAPGLSPATALPVAEMQTTLSHLRCACGATYPDARWPRLTMLYDGQKINVLQLRCPSCEQPRDMHFVLPTTEPLPTAKPREERA